MLSVEHTGLRPLPNAQTETDDPKAYRLSYERMHLRRNDARSERRHSEAVETAGHGQSQALNCR